MCDFNQNPVTNGEYIYITSIVHSLTNQPSWHGGWGRNLSYIVKFIFEIGIKPTDGEFIYISSIKSITYLIS